MGREWAFAFGLVGAGSLGSFAGSGRHGVGRVGGPPPGRCEAGAGIGLRSRRGRRSHGGGHPDRPSDEKDLGVSAGSEPLLWGWVLLVAWGPSRGSGRHGWGRVGGPP
jgi:hypothetical protein